MNDVSKSLDKIIELLGSERLGDALEPATVVIQRDKPKSTKREKIALKYFDEKIKIERKEEKKEKRKKKNWRKSFRDKHQEQIKKAKNNKKWQKHSSEDTKKVSYPSKHIKLSIL